MSGTLLSTGSLESGQTLPVRRFKQGRHLSSRSPSTPKPAIILSIMSDQETQSLSSMETAEPSILTVDLFGRARASLPPTGSPGRPRSPPRPVEASPPARVAHSGCPSSRLHGPPKPGPRCEAGARAPGLRLNSRPRPRRGLTLPQRLVTLGGAGDGTAGRGRGREPSGGRGSCSRGNCHDDEKIRSEKEKLRRRRGGEGRKAGLRQEE